MNLRMICAMSRFSVHISFVGGIAMSEWKKGSVAWFNDSTGDGVVVSDDGTRYYVHYSSIQPTFTLKSKTRLTLKEGESVKFKPLQANYVNQVAYLKVERR